MSNVTIRVKAGRATDKLTERPVPDGEYDCRASRTIYPATELDPRPGEDIFSRIHTKRCNLIRETGLEPAYLIIHPLQHKEVVMNSSRFYGPNDKLMGMRVFVTSDAKPGEIIVTR